MQHCSNDHYHSKQWHKARDPRRVRMCVSSGADRRMHAHYVPGGRTHAHTNNSSIQKNANIKKTLQCVRVRFRGTFHNLLRLCTHLSKNPPYTNAHKRINIFVCVCEFVRVRVRVLVRVECMGRGGGGGLLTSERIRAHAQCVCVWTRSRRRMAFEQRTHRLQRPPQPASHKSESLANMYTLTRMHIPAHGPTIPPTHKKTHAQRSTHTNTHPTNNLTIFVSVCCACVVRVCCAARSFRVSEIMHTNDLIPPRERTHNPNTANTVHGKRNAYAHY